MRDSTRVAVIGAGVAGFCAYQAMKEAGLDVLWFGDVNGSQRPPAALMHAFPGRSFDVPSELHDAFGVAFKWCERGFESVAVQVERHLEPGSREERSFHRVKDRFPELLQWELSGEYLRYGPAYVVDLRAMGRSGLINEEVEAVVVRREGIEVITSKTYNVDALVVCPGAALSDWWECQHTIYGGEFVSTREYHPNLVWSDDAHYLPTKDGCTLGFTFLEDGVLRPDHEVLEEFRRRSGLGLVDGDVWRGRRVVHHDRQPICGEIIPRVWLLGALGARGLLLSPFLGECIRDQVLGLARKIPALFDVERSQGTLGPKIRLTPGDFG